MDQDTDPADPDTIGLALALLGRALNGVPYTGPLVDLDLDIPALAQTSPLELRDALPTETIERLAALAEHVDWTGYPAECSAEEQLRLARLNCPDCQNAHPAVRCCDVHRQEPRGLMAMIDLSGDLPEVLPDRRHWAELIDSLPPATIELSGHFETMRNGAWDTVGPDDSGPHYASELTRATSHKVTAVPGFWESGDLPLDLDPGNPSDHPPGTCHFCHRVAGDTRDDGYDAQYGVWFCGCDKGMGVLRVWSLNGVRWGAKPSETCACTRHTAPSPAGHREPHTPGVSERGRRSPHGPISYDGPPLPDRDHRAEACALNCLPGLCKLDRPMYGARCVAAPQTPVIDWDQVRRDMRGRAPTITFAPLKGLPPQAADPEPPPRDAFTEIGHRVYHRSDGVIWWAQHVLDARPARLAKPIESQWTDVDRTAAQDLPSIAELGTQFEIANTAADLADARARARAAARRAVVNRWRMRAARWIAGVPIKVKDQKESDQ